MNSFLHLALAVVLLISCQADEQTRRVQEELRRRNIYFAEINGQRTEITVNALRRYQQRKGLAITGAIDAETLRSLDLPAPPNAVPPPPDEVESFPEEPVLKSDAARAMAEKDRELLRELAENPEPWPIAERTVPEEKPEPAADAAPPVDRPPAPAASLAEEAETFVRRYLEVGESNRVDDEMAFFADRVAYFDHGTVGADFIMKDIERYCRRWPDRNYRLLRLDVVPARDDADATLEVRFRIAYRVQNGKKRASGKTDNLFRIRRSPEGMRLVSVSEQRARD